LLYAVYHTITRLRAIAKHPYKQPILVSTKKTKNVTKFLQLKLITFHKLEKTQEERE